MATTEEILSAKQGTFIVNVLTEVTKTFDVAIVVEEAIFTSLKMGGVDVKDDYIADATIKVPSGSIIRSTDNTVFSGLQVSQGIVCLIL